MFWVRHGIACRRISAYIAEKLGQPVLNNIWIPDGYKDIPADRLGPRLRLKDSASGITLMAKGWNMATAFPPSSVGSRIRVAYTPRLDYYRGVASIDVGIKDWQPVAD